MPDVACPNERGLVDDEADAPGEVAEAAGRRADLEHAPLLDDALEQLARREPRALPVQLREVPHRVRDRMVGRERRPAAVRSRPTGRRT